MVVIFGASGNAGRTSAAALRRAGLAVRAVVRNREQGESLAKIGCEIALADLTDPTSTAKAIEGAHAVQILCPVPLADAAPGDTMRRMIDTAAAALRANPPPRVLAISDYGAELSSGTGITLLFHHLEAALRPVATHLTLLRSAEHMQNWARVMPAAFSTGLLPSLHQPLDRRFPTVAAQDVGAVAAELLMKDAASPSPRVVSIEGPERVSALGVADILGQVIGREIAAHALPRHEWHAALLGAGLGEQHVQLIVDLYDTQNAGLIDVETNVSERRFGTTPLRKVFAALVPRVAEAER